MYKKINSVLLMIILLFSVSFFIYGQESVPPEVLLIELNNIYKSGPPQGYNFNFHYAMVSECIAKLMEKNDSSSYPALFSVLTSGYPELIASEALGALDIIPGDMLSFLLSVIRDNPSAEKFLAFRTGINSHKLTVSERGQLAEKALEMSFSFTEDDADITAMRYLSVLALANLEWKRASQLAIKHYYRVQEEFSQRKVSKDRFLEAISCLGAVGDSEAAMVLALQLGLINARKERTGVFDPEITIATIYALGRIGDNAAFANLLFATNLPYDEDITSAAREAIARLKW